MGLSQQQLAELIDLSRATINALESGKLNDLSSKRIERLANELGFSVGLIGIRRPKEKSSLEAAARVASVPYSAVLPPSVLLDSIKEAVVPPAYIPHMRTLLQEAPVAILADLVEELQQTHGVPRPDTWKRMRMLAGALKCDRRLWQNQPT